MAEKTVSLQHIFHVISLGRNLFAYPERISTRHRHLVWSAIAGMNRNVQISGWLGRIKMYKPRCYDYEKNMRPPATENICATRYDTTFNIMYLAALKWIFYPIPILISNVQLFQSTELTCNNKCKKQSKIVLHTMLKLVGTY